MRKTRILLVEVGLAVLLNITAGLLQRPVAIALAKFGWWALILTIIYFVVSDEKAWPRLISLQSRLGLFIWWSGVVILGVGIALFSWYGISKGCDLLFSELPNAPPLKSSATAAMPMPGPETKPLDRKTEQRETATNHVPMLNPKASSVHEPSQHVFENQISEAVQFDITLEASQELIRSIPKDNQDPLLNYYHSHAETLLGTRRLLPAQYYETAWRVTFGQFLFCDVGVGAHSAISIMVSKHPFCFLTISNTIVDKKCAVRAYFSLPPDISAMEIPLAEAGYGMWLPYSDRPAITVRTGMTGAKMHEFFQGTTPSWNAFAISDPDRDTPELSMGFSPTQWNDWQSIKPGVMKHLNTLVPLHMTVKTYLMADGPAIIRKFSIEHLWEGPKSSDIYIWTRTSYCEEPHPYGSPLHCN